MEAAGRAAGPLRGFMLRYAREKDLALFLDLAHETRPHRPEDLPIRVVVPAYIISELKSGFQIGAALFLPFLVIRLGGGSCGGLDWHVAVAAGGDFDPAQAVAVRHGGWLAFAGWFSDAKFWVKRWG